MSDHSRLMEKETKPFLFIAGAPRCGTTTLFDTLSGHPGIVAARIKEPGFLIPRKFPMKGFRHLYLEDGMDRYRGLFGSREGLRMEASATYLYVPGVAENIREYFTNAKVILILRNPVSRFISEYRFAIMMRVIPHNTSFTDYLALQRQQADSDLWREPHMRALSNGCYSRFVMDYLTALGRSRVHIAWTESLHSDPKGTLQGICKFVGIDPGYFESFTFRRSNKSRQIRYPYLYALWFYCENWRTRVIAKRGRGRVTRLWKRLTRPLFNMSTMNAQPIQMTQAEKQFLESYYRDEPAQLQTLFGERPPW